MAFSSYKERVMFARRWTGFVSAIWLMIFSGSYAFSNYSTALKKVLGINQKQLNRLSVAKDLGDSCGILAGILSNYLPAWALLCIGACIGFMGYGIQWLVISGIINPLPYWIMFIAAMVAGNSISWMNTSVFSVSVRNFPRNRGPVVGLFKAYMGLSAAIFSSLCDTLFSSSSSMYLLMLVFIPPSFCLLTALFFRPVPPAETEEEENAERGSVLIFNIIASALAIFIIIQDFVPDLKQGPAKPVTLILLFVILAAPAVVPVFLFFKLKKLGESREITKESTGGVREEEEEEVMKSIGAHEANGSDDDRKVLTNNFSNNNYNSQSGDIERDGLGRRLLDHYDSSSNNDRRSLEESKQSSAAARAWGCCGGCCSSSSTEQLGEDRSTLSLFKTWHFYVLYFALFCGAGSGMAFSNNLGQVGQSFGYTTVTLFTSLFSLGNFFGRIVAGNVSEYFLRVVAMPRPAWMGVVKLPMIALFSWLSTGSGASLYAGSLVLGFCHGSLITLTIPTISEFYGLKYFGTNFMVTNTHLLAGSSVLSGLLAGYLYDQQATSDGDDTTSLTCYGSACYGTTFLVYVAILTAALALDALLTVFSRPLYRKLRAINTHLE